MNWPDCRTCGGSISLVLEGDPVRITMQYCTALFSTSITATSCLGVRPGLWNTAHCLTILYTAEGDFIRLMWCILR